MINHIEQVDTPAVIVDLDRVERNIEKLQAYCDEHGLANRPHIKTHKLPFIAHKQLRAGACGITVQTIGEAEVMVAAGITDIFLTYNVIGERKAHRLSRVAQLANLRVGLDNRSALNTLGQAASLAGRTIGVLIEFESGKKRQGVLRPEEALELAREVLETEHLEFLGVMTYPSSPTVSAWIAKARDVFDAAGLKIEVASAGGTPGMWRAHEIEGLTEYRAGTYIYHDRKSIAKGSADLNECALHIHVTLVSMPTQDRGVIDAGSKVLTSDTVPAEIGEGYGLILEYPEAVIGELSEEHGVIDFSACSTRPKIGERLRVLPNHVCPVSNLVDEVVLHRGGIIEAVLPVAARGKR